MKKLLFAVMAGALLSVSCVKDICEPVQMERDSADVSLTATTEKPVGTRSIVPSWFRLPSQRA